MELDWLAFSLAFDSGSALVQLYTLGKLLSLAGPLFLDI